MADYSGAHSEASMNGMFKETYEDNLTNLIPDGKKVLQNIKFAAKQKQPGNAFHSPVILN